MTALGTIAVGVGYILCLQRDTLMMKLGLSMNDDESTGESAD